MGAAMIPLQVQTPQPASPLQTVGGLMQLRSQITENALRQASAARMQAETADVQAQAQQRQRDLQSMTEAQNLLKDPTVRKQFAGGDYTALAEAGITPTVAKNFTDWYTGLREKSLSIDERTAKLHADQRALLAKGLMGLDPNDDDAAASQYSGFIQNFSKDAPEVAKQFPQNIPPQQIRKSIQDLTVTNGVAQSILEERAKQKQTAAQTGASEAATAKTNLETQLLQHQQDLYQTLKESPDALKARVAKSIDPQKYPEEYARAVNEAQNAPDLKSMNEAIGKHAQMVGEQEKSIAVATNPESNEAKIAQAMARGAALGQTREYAVIDTKNNNTPQYLSANDVNEANRKEPGRYMPAGTAVPALTKTALIEDIRGNINDVRHALSAMPDFDAMDKAKIAVALHSRDPRGSINALITGGALGSLSAQGQQYLINTTNLIENAMAMRSVLGAGQGSDDVRSAIIATIPGPATPNKEYAGKQLDQFEKVLGRLERGIPNVPLRTDTGVAGKPIVQHSASTGAYRYSVDGGKTWQAGQPPTQ